MQISVMRNIFVSWEKLFGAEINKCSFVHRCSGDYYFVHVFVFCAVLFVVDVDTSYTDPRPPLSKPETIENIFIISTQIALRGEQIIFRSGTQRTATTNDVVLFVAGYCWLLYFYRAIKLRSYRNSIESISWKHNTIDFRHFCVGDSLVVLSFVSCYLGLDTRMHFSCWKLSVYNEY